MAARGLRLVRRTALVVIAAMAGSLLVTVHASAAMPIAFYWTDRNGATVNRTDPMGATQQLVAPTGGRLQDVDLDPGTSTLYFSEWGPVGPPGGQGSINRVDTDGTGLAQVLGTGDAVHQLALDQANDRIFFTRGVSYDTHEVSVVNDDGTGYTPLFGPFAFGGPGHFPSGLALDDANAKVYWGDVGVVGGPPRGSVNVMDIDGTGPTELTPHVDGRGRGFALHEGIIYLTAHDFRSPASGGGIFTYDIANDVETQIISEPTTGFWDIEVDPVGERIYFTNYGAGTIESAAFDGSDRRIEVSGLTNPTGLALEFPVPQSTFFPEPLDSDGDGILDRQDDCPNEAGPAATNGCPDADGDEIADRDDDCPSRAGPAETNGCPDTDGDGILDRDDLCPNQAGTPAERGCPAGERDAEQGSSPKMKANSWVTIRRGSPFQGSVFSGEPGCKSGRRVVLRRRVPGPDRWIARDRTGQLGRWWIDGVSDPDGHFYAKVKKKRFTDEDGTRVICRPKRSRVLDLSG